MVRHRERDTLAGGVGPVNGLAVVATSQLDRAADEAELALRSSAAGQQAGLGQHLEAVADAEHAGAALGAAAITSRITGERAAMAPQRR